MLLPQRHTIRPLRPLAAPAGKAPTAVGNGHCLAVTSSMGRALKSAQPGRCGGIVWQERCACLLCVRPLGVCHVKGTALPIHFQVLEETGLKLGPDVRFAYAVNSVFPSGAHYGG